MRVYLILMISLIFSGIANADTKAPTKSSVLIEIAQAIGELGDSIVKITDGVKHLVVTSSDGVDFVLAKKTKVELVELSVQSNQFVISQNARAVRSIDDYLKNPSPQAWNDVKENLSAVLHNGSALLQEWHKERSDFVLEESYFKLLSSLNARVGLLQKLKSLPPPMTKEELRDLEAVNTEYKKLIVEFRQAIEELNIYIKQNNA